jgi:hypothetical protein
MKTPSSQPCREKEEGSRVQVNHAALDIRGEGLSGRESSCNMAAEAAAGKKRATRKHRVSQETIDFLLARAKEPRPVLRVNHELLDSLKTLTPEERERKCAIKTKAVENLQALRDWEADLVRRYHTYGYLEVELDEEEDDSDYGEIWNLLPNNL